MNIGNEKKISCIIDAKSCNLHQHLSDDDKMTVREKIAAYQIQIAETEKCK